MDNKKHRLGSLFGADIVVETDNKNTALECRKWLETMDLRYRKFGEEQFKI